jgi:putative SOS response-associated peptidase YedK
VTSGCDPETSEAGHACNAPPFSVESAPVAVRPVARASDVSAAPVLVPAELRADWLNPSLVEPERAKELLAAIPEPFLTPREVSNAVNFVRNNGPELVEPVAS